MRHVCRRSAKRFGAVALLALSLAATSADARDQDRSIGDASIDLVLFGSIVSKCSVGGGGTINLGELSGSQQASAHFDVGCNVPFEMTFRSLSGGIAHVKQPQGEGPYAGLVPYRLNVSVPALSPLPTELHADFTSSQMVAGGVLNSGDAIAAGGGEIRLQTELAPGRDLLAGQYADSITIVIHPRV